MDRQRMLMIFGVAWLSAALLTWFLYAKTKAPKTERTVRVIAAATDLAAGTKLHKGNLRMVAVLERDQPRGALKNPADVIGRALIYPVNGNEPITATKLSSLAGAEGVAATIEPGRRAVSISFTDASGVSGLIQPHSRVDVLFTRTSGSLPEAMTVTILEDVEVISVGRITDPQVLSAAAAKSGASRSQTQTATLSVTPEEAKKVELAKNNGKISLALRNPLDRSRLEQNSPPATAEALDPMLLVRTGRKVRPMNVDKKTWARLTGEDEEKTKAPPKPPPPKPRLVVDVYRGDKHVQEIFQ